MGRKVIIFVATVTEAIPEIEMFDPAAEAKPVALVAGEPFLQLPEDLYIPPDALEVILETFAGPMDLLLYLIRKQNLDILNIPIAEVTAQYLAYIELMQELRIELAAEYLVMAALLAEIKSRMLLPRPITEEGEEIDPRAELIRRLQEYEVFKKAAEDLEALPQLHRDTFNAHATVPDWELPALQPQVDLKSLLLAFTQVLKRTELLKSHEVRREVLSIRARMTDILSALQKQPFVEFAHLFHFEEGRLGIVVTFIAVLELWRQSLIEVVQTESFAPIHLKAKIETEDL